MQELGRVFSHCDCGRNFREWIYDDDPKPYESCGNGAAMRISIDGFTAQNIQAVSCRE